jgi:hypothetical protein
MRWVFCGNILIGQRLKALNEQVLDETRGPVKNEWNKGVNKTYSGLVLREEVYGDSRLTVMYPQWWIGYH